MKNVEKYLDKFIDGIKNTFGCNEIYEMMFDKRCNADSSDDDIEWETPEEFDELCRTKFCVNCKFKCGVTKWLLEEYKETCPLKHNEYVILKNLDSMWKWIARNGSLNCLYVYENKPYKNKQGLVCWETDEGFWNISFFVNVFQFVKWEDEEPYEIAKLIADYEKEHGECLNQK